MRRLLEPEPLAPLTGPLNPAQQPGAPGVCPAHHPGSPGVYHAQHPCASPAAPAAQAPVAAPPRAGAGINPSLLSCSPGEALEATQGASDVPTGHPRVRPRGPVHRCGGMPDRDKGAGLPQASEISGDWSAGGVPGVTLACFVADSHSHHHYHSHSHSESPGASPSHGRSPGNRRRGHGRSRSSSTMREGPGGLDSLGLLRGPMEASISGPASLATALVQRQEREREAVLAPPAWGSAAGAGAAHQRVDKGREGGRPSLGSSQWPREMEQGGVPPQGSGTLASGGSGMSASGGSGTSASGGSGALASGGSGTSASGGSGAWASGGSGAWASGGSGAWASGGSGAWASGGQGALASAMVQRVERREQRRRERAMRRRSLGTRTASMSDGTMDWLHIEDLIAEGTPLHPGVPPKAPSPVQAEPTTGAPPFLACAEFSPSPLPEMHQHTTVVPLLLASAPLALPDPCNAPTGTPESAMGTRMAQPSHGTMGLGPSEAEHRACAVGQEQVAGGAEGGEQAPVGSARGAPRAPRAPRARMAPGQGPEQLAGLGFELWEEDVEDGENGRDYAFAGKGTSAAFGKRAPASAKVSATECRKGGGVGGTPRGCGRTLGWQQENELREALVRSLSENETRGHPRYGAHAQGDPELIGRTKSDQPGSTREAEKRGYLSGAPAVYRGGSGAAGNESKGREVEREGEGEGERKGALDPQEGAPGESSRRSMPPRPPSTLAPRREGRRMAPANATPPPPPSPPLPPPVPYSPPVPFCDSTTPPPCPPLLGQPASGAPPLGCGSPGSPFSGPAEEDLPWSRSGNTAIGPGSTARLLRQEGGTGTGTHPPWHSPGPVSHRRSSSQEGVAPALPRYGAHPVRPPGGPSRFGEEELAELQRVFEMQRERKRALLQTQRTAQGTSVAGGSSAELEGGVPEHGAVSSFVCAWVASEGHRVTPLVPNVTAPPLVTVTPSPTGDATVASFKTTGASLLSAPTHAPTPSAPASWHT